MHGDILTSVYGTGLIDRPADGAVVDNHVTSLIAPEPVGLPSPFVAYTETEIADYGVVGAQRHLMSGYTYPLSGGCLSGKGEVARGDAQG